MRFMEKVCQLRDRRPARFESRSGLIGALHRTSGTCLVLLLVWVVAGVAPVLAEAPKPGPATSIFVGKIRTMRPGDDEAFNGAVAVDGKGLIVDIGNEDAVLARAKGITPAPQQIRLEPGQTLLPGFLDAHLHVDGPLVEHSGLAQLVGPCRPKPYNKGNEPCSNYIKVAFERVRTKLGFKADQGLTFIVGINLDPSRQWYDQKTRSKVFTQSPAKLIEEVLTKKRPVLILDQSGHFGYVNQKAFEALHASICGLKAACANWPPKLGDGGEWNTKPEGCTPTYPAGPDCQYTGLLTEIPGYAPFMPAVGDSVLVDLLTDPYIWLNNSNKYRKYKESVERGVTRTLKDFREAGLTTVCSMASSANGVKLTKYLAEHPASGTRIMTIVEPDIANQMAGKGLTSTDGVPLPSKPSCPKGSPGCVLPMDLGVTGIKVILDGSTQGCTAAMQLPVLYRTAEEGGECSPPKGRSNYPTPDDVEQLRRKLKPLWNTDAWRFEFHANGNRALDMALGLYDSLQREKPNDHVVTVIHATVGDTALWKRAAELRTERVIEGRKIPPIDLRFTHLIAHVAYWGAVFESQLGKESAANIDPTDFDQDYSIPFTLHSDATVSVPAPLWFVRQAVTRETWIYPDLEKSYVLGSKPKLTVLQALQAVTIRTAEEKELEKWLGSIEVGKVADFVVLSADPVEFKNNPDGITGIKVINTYLGGKPTGPPMQ